MKTLHLTNPLMHGNDVKAVQRLLVTAGYRHIRVDGVYGPATAAAVLDAKKYLGYTPEQRKPIAGEKFVGALHRARMPLVEEPAKPRKTKRDGVVAYCRWAIEHEPSIHYAMVRPIPVGAPRHLPMRTDCSGLVTLAYKDAAAADPNRRGYDGTGYTGTLLEQGRPVTLTQARPGDAVIFGTYPGVHVCVVLEPGADPLLCSHGQERGPIAIRYSAELAYHRSKGHGQVSIRSYLP